ASITAVTGAHAVGFVSVVVASPDGQSGTLTDSFSFSSGNPPTLANVAPATGSAAGGTEITVTGDDFLLGATVSVGGTPATSARVVSPTTITAVTAAHAPGAVDVVVTNPDTKTGTLTNGFTFGDVVTPGDSGGGGHTPPPPPDTAPAPLGPDAPSGLTASVAGTTVTLVWSAASTGAPATSYVIEAGSFSAGTDLAVISTGNASTSFTAENVAAGTYFVRVRAQNIYGTSAPSNEVAVTVGGGQGPRVSPDSAPGRPTGLVATVNGTTVVFAWSAPSAADGGNPTSYTIVAGSASGLADLASLSTGSPATSFSVGNVPAGVYYVRVLAANAAGSSPPSNEVVVVVSTAGPVPPCTAAPPAPAGLAFVVHGSTVTLGWNAAAGATSYVLEAGSNPGASDLVVSDTGNNSNRFVATGVGAGAYFVRIRARNACGTSGVSNEVVVVVQ
ncbi:MAG TPA: fibronectin type III domain-containing protein, partial [Vicinamibacterales bacterium]|nr:fibronectin type III domain-containing protein [Vicinamibacterales bacterium]